MNAKIFYQKYFKNNDSFLGRQQCENQVRTSRNLHFDEFFPYTFHPFITSFWRDI